MPGREFILPIRVYYEDTDAGGVVYHSKYLNFFERARTEWLRYLGFEQDELRENDDTIFAVRSVQADYLKPARFNDEIIVKTQLKQLKKVSMTFTQTICENDSNDVLCQLTALVACISSSQLKPKVIPKELVNKMEAFSGC